MRTAFDIARSGRPGPVVVDIPRDVQLAKGAFQGSGLLPLHGYRQRLEDWKVRNAAAFQKFSASPDAAAKLNERLSADRAKPFPDTPEGRAARGAHCARMLGAIQPGRGTK